MSAMQRTKGQAGEREVCKIIADLTGHEVKRRVRNHAGDSDVLGVPGWSIEVKRYARATPGMIESWWAQTVVQAGQSLLPVLFYRVNRGDWRAVWSIAPGLTHQRAEMWGGGYEWTAEGSPQAWAAVARNLADVP